MKLFPPKKDFLSGSLFFIPTACLFVLGLACSDGPAPHSLAAAAVLTDTIPLDRDTLPPPATFKVIGVGDMMLGTNYPSPAYLPPNGGADLLADVQDILRAGTVTFGNLEGTILDKGGTPKRCNNPNACYAFRSPESYIRHFSDAGFDLLSLANNHSGDFGPEGRARTKALLDEASIAYAGLAGADEWAVIERDGVRFGFCAFAPNRGTCDIRNIPAAVALVQRLAEKADVVIVSFHGGAEGPKHQNVPRRTETYYGEDRGDVYKFAHALVDAGADIIFGHGPHVTRAMEVYRDRLICYSLGNFCTYGRFNVGGPNGLAPLVEVEVDSSGAFLAGKVIPVYQAKTHGPKIDPQKRVIPILQQLTKTDFPETRLVIEDDGALVLSKKD